MAAKRKCRMNSKLIRESSPRPAFWTAPNFECRFGKESPVRHRPIEPGYYLLRLRLRYGTKGARPLAKLL
jgi:hypothetical protein